MTQFIYGMPNTVIAIGMRMVNGEPMPFVGIVNEKIEGLATGSKDTNAMLDLIEERGGVVIMFSDPDAATRFHALMSKAFTYAESTSWGNKEEIVRQ